MAQFCCVRFSLSLWSSTSPLSLFLSLFPSPLCLSLCLALSLSLSLTHTHTLSLSLSLSLSVSLLVSLPLFLCAFPQTVETGAWRGDENITRPTECKRPGKTFLQHFFKLTTWCRADDVIFHCLTGEEHFFSFVTYLQSSFSCGGDVTFLFYWSECKLWLLAKWVTVLHSSNTKLLGVIRVFGLITYTFLLPLPLFSSFVGWKVFLRKTLQTFSDFLTFFLQMLAFIFCLLPIHWSQDNLAPSWTGIVARGGSLYKCSSDYAHCFPALKTCRLV